MTTTVQETRLPFSRPAISEAAIEAVGEVLRSGWITSGPKVLEFEKQFAAYCGAKHAIAVSSATAGLDLAVGLIGLEPDDEVIVPSVNWVSGPNMVELHGGKTVFCDVERDSMQIDLASVAARITPRTRAIMPVHFAGAPCDMSALRALASKHAGTVLIEDAAHATGTLARGIPIGRDSELAVFSFHPSKNMTTGEGGMVVTNSDEHADRLKLARFHGIRKDAWKHSGRSGRDLYQVLDPGRKYNLTDIQAVIGLHQLREVDAFNARRHALALGYHERLRSLKTLRPLALPRHADDRHSWHIFVVLLDVERLKGGRAAVVDALEQQGIGTAIHYPAVHTQQYYAARYPGAKLPVSEAAGERLLSLPLFPQMHESDLDRVAEALRKVEREPAHQGALAPARRMLSARAESVSAGGRWARDLAVLCAATAALYAVLCAHPLIGSYTRYVLSGREMVDSGDWVVPHLSYVPYFEKPILVYWFSAASQLLFGTSSFAIHLPSGIASLISVLCTYALGRKLRSPAFGLAAAAMLLVSGLFLAMSTVLTTDPLFACWLALAWLAYWLHERRPGRGWVWLFWSALGLAWLTKGPLALVLVGVSLTGYFLLLGGWRTLWREGLRLRPIAGLCVIAAINAPWHWLVWQRDPRYLEMFYLRVNLRGLYDESVNHAGPFWTYGPMTAVALLPWTLAGLAALGIGLWLPLARAVRERIAALRSTTDAGAQTSSAFASELERGRLYLACVFLFPLLFLSASASKLFTYLLPLLPAMILIVADVIATRADRPPAWLRRAVVGQAALVLVACAGAWFLFRERLPLDKLRPEGLPLAGAAVALALAGQIGAAAAVARGRLVAGLALAGAGLALALCVVLPGLDRITYGARAEELARKAALLAAPDDRFVISEHCVQDYTIALSLLRRCGVLGKARELAMGHFTEVTPTTEPFPSHLPDLRRKDLPQNHWLYDWKLLCSEWSEPRRVWYFGHFDAGEPGDDDAQRLRNEGLAVYEVGRVHDVALLTNLPVSRAD